MALVKATLSAGILALMTDMRSRTDVSDQDYADGMADLIDAYIKTGTVTVPIGVAVATTGTPAAQTGATTAPGVGTIS